MSGTQSPSLKIKHRHYTEENKESASQKAAKPWDGARTRSSVNLKEEEIAEWIEQITRKKIVVENEDQLATTLSDGQLLCQLVNIIEGKDKRTYPSKTEERITYFFDKCRNFGVPDGLQFDFKYDLQMKQNVVQVIYYLHALAEKCHSSGKAPFFKGSKTERKKQKSEWRAKAKKALEINQPNFDHWDISPNLLSQLKHEPESPSAPSTPISISRPETPIEVEIPIIEEPPVIDNHTESSPTKSSQSMEPPSSSPAVPSTPLTSSPNKRTKVGRRKQTTSAPKIIEHPPEPTPSVTVLEEPTNNVNNNNSIMPTPESKLREMFLEPASPPLPESEWLIPDEEEPWTSPRTFVPGSITPIPFKQVRDIPPPPPFIPPQKMEESYPIFEESVAFTTEHKESPQIFDIQATPIVQQSEPVEPVKENIPRPSMASRLRNSLLRPFQATLSRSLKRSSESKTPATSRIPKMLIHVLSKGGSKGEEIVVEAKPVESIPEEPIQYSPEELEEKKKIAEERRRRQLQVMKRRTGLAALCTAWVVGTSAWAYVFSNYGPME